MTPLIEAAQDALELLEDMVEESQPDCGMPNCEDCKAMREIWQIAEALRVAIEDAGRTLQ